MVYWNYGSIFACDLKKCPMSLYLPLLGTLEQCVKPAQN